MEDACERAKERGCGKESDCENEWREGETEREVIQIKFFHFKKNELKIVVKNKMCYHANKNVSTCK